MRRLHVIVLAAGSSKRFRGNKLLHLTGGRPLASYLIDKLETVRSAWSSEEEQKTCTKMGDVVVVSQYEQLFALLPSHGQWSKVSNFHPEWGISHSIVLGLQRLEEANHLQSDDLIAFFVCDMPLLKTETIRAFFLAYLQQEKGIGAMCAEGQPGNPAVFHARYVSQLKQITGDRGGSQVWKQVPQDCFWYPVPGKEMQDVDERRTVIVRGGGDLATGTIYELYRRGFDVLVLEVAKPSCIRRQVAFCEAVYEGETIVQGVKAVRVSSLEEVKQVWKDRVIPVLVDPLGETILTLQPQVVVDAVIAKKNLGTRMDMAPLTIALGPGFEAGVDVDYVVETMRGPSLGQVYTQGFAIANTGIPGMVGGYAKERVIHAPAEGIISYQKRIGEEVQKEEVLAMIGKTPVLATIDGILRGAIREGCYVKKGLKIMDIDPRIDQKEACFLISDKASLLGSAVAGIIEEWERQQCTSGN